MRPASTTETNFPLGPALEFLKRLWHLNHGLERLSARMERDLGVTAQQRLIVRCLGKYPSMTGGELAELLHLDPGTVSSTLNRLEKKKLIERRRQSKDRRRVTLALTPKGKLLDRPTFTSAERAVQELLDGDLGPEVDTVMRVLERLAEHLERQASGAQSTVPKKRA